MAPVFKIYPYKAGSAGARNLAVAMQKQLGYKVLRVEPDYVIQKNEWIINWGSGYFRVTPAPGGTNIRVFNPKDRVCRCINKSDFFRAVEETVNLPAHTDSYTTALRWINDGHKVYCRTNEEGKDGDGIVVVSTKSALVEAHLYTRAVDADKEYRVHVFGHKPIFDLEKYHEDGKVRNQDVRSGKLGWHYTRDTTVPEEARVQAVAVSKAIKMDFVAVDLLYNTKTNKATVLEANSAPELGPWTSAAYARCFAALL